MKIIVSKIKEMKDGSALCNLDLDKEAVEFLVAEGFLSVLKKAIDNSEAYVKINEESDKC